MPDYITAGSFSRSSTPINIVRPKVKKYTLTDLRNDSEFNEITERFLSSIGQGDSVGDLFGYFRGADYNLWDGMSSYADSKKFTEQQKKDYQYLRNKFDNASIGGIGEWVKAGANVTKEMFTDPTMIASMLFVPWTGGTSFASRIAASKAVQTGLKAMTSKELAKGVAKGVAKLPGQKIKEPLSKNAITAITSAEGMLYGSSNNFVRQNIDINTDRRDNINLAETAAMGAIGAAIPVGVRGLGAGISKFQNSVADRRLARIEGGEDYKAGVLDKGLAKKDEIIDQLTPNLLKLTRFVQKPTSRFKEKMNESDLLNKLIKKFRYDTDKSILDDPSKIVEKSDWSFFENVNNRLGPKRDKVKEILDTLKEKGKVSKPKIGSRDAFFKLPSFIYDAPEATKQSYFKWQRISDPVNDALAYYLRTGRKTVDVDGKRVSLERAFKMTEKTTDDVVKAGDEIKIVLREIRNDANNAGLEVGRIVNYLPRGFNYRAVQKELENFKKGIDGELVKEIKRSEGITAKGEIESLLEEIINPTVPTGKSYSLLMKEVSGEVDDIEKVKGTRGVSFFGIGSKKIPSFVKKRQLRNLDETKIADYLDNNVENLLYDYTYNSSSFIQRKIDLGEDIVEFENRFLEPIKKELKEKGKDLSTEEYEKLIDIYLVTTGQVRQLDTGFRQALADFAVVGNQLALLPLATITSLSEVAVPLVRGAGKKLIQKGKAGTEKEIGEGGIRTVWNTAGDYRKMWWNDVVKKDIADARPETLKELNRFGRAWDRASEDRSLAMFGQGYGRRGTMAQNKFFKVNLLHDWTRFVQLTSFNVGKSKIYENLYELATVKNIKKSRRIRLENQLRELNVDIGAGKRWVKNGGKPNGKFYNENLLPSAARYVDEVVMNPTAAANQKPLWHSMPSTRWAFGLMGFPTAFSNTVLKNAVREINFDIKTKTLQSTPEIAAGATAMISIGMFGNTLRTGGRNLEEIEKGEKTIGEEVRDAAIRTGLLGPTEQLYRTQKGTEYDNFARSIVQRFTGPAIDDIFRFFDDWNGPLSFAVDEAPGIALLRTTNPEAYKAIVKGAREYDKAMGLTAQGKSKKEEKRKDRPLFSQGGKVKLVNPRYKNFKGGEVSEENPVPNAAPEPSERVNPYTGQPYEAEMERLGFAEGGEPIENIVKDLMEAGFDRKEAIAGLLGNIGVETGYTYEHTKRGANNAHGLFGLDPSEKGKKAAYDLYLQKNNKQDSRISQGQFVYDTIYGDSQDIIGRGNAEKLREVFEKGTVEEITTDFSNIWERPGVPHLDRRNKTANEWFNRLDKKDGGLIVSIGVAPVSEKQIDKLKKGLKKRKAMRDGGDTENGGYPTLQDKDYDAVLESLGGLDKEEMKKRSFEWAENKQKDYPTFNFNDLENAYIHAISSYELATSNPEGGEADKGLQKRWRPLARQIGMQVKEGIQAAEALGGSEIKPNQFVEALKDRRNNRLGLAAFSMHRENKEDAYNFIDRKITERLDSIVSGEGERYIRGPVINKDEEMYLPKMIGTGEKVIKDAKRLVKGYK